MHKYLFFLLYVYSSFSQADNYYWYNDRGRFDNPVDGCPKSGSWSNGGTWAFTGIYFSNPNSVACLGLVTYPDGGTTEIITDYVSRGGTSCAAGNNYDTSSGICVPVPPDLQKCLDAKDAVQQSYSWEQSTDNPHPPSIGGCATSISGVSICRPSLSGSGFTCTADVTITGDLYQDPGQAPGSDPGSGNGSDPGSGAGGSSGGGSSGGGSSGGGSSGGGSSGGGSSGGGSSGGGSSGGGSSGGGSSGGGSSGGGSSGGGSSGGGSSGGGSSGGGSSGGGSSGGGSSGGGSSGGGSSGGGSSGGDGEGEGEEGSGPGGLTPPVQGSFDGVADEWQQKIDQSKSDLKDKLNDLQSSFNPISDISLSSGGSLICPAPATFFGHSISFCLNKYISQLSWIAQAIYFACAALALFIIFG